MGLTRSWASGLIPVAAIVGISFALPGTVLVSAATGVASSLAAPFTERGYSWCCRRFLRPGSVVNHDLQRALLRAFTDAVWDLERLWLSSYQRDIHHSRRGSDDDPEVVKALFTDMRSDAAEILSNAHLAKILQNADALQRWNRAVFTFEPDPPPKKPEQSGPKGPDPSPETTDANRPEDIKSVRIAVASEKNALRAYLAPYLDGHSDQLVRFLYESFALQLACRFGEELKTNEPAWRAYERLVGESLIAGVQALDANQRAAQVTLDKIVQQLKEWQENLLTEPRDPKILSRLDAAITTTRDHVIDTLAIEFNATRAEIRNRFEAAGAVIIAEGEKTRAHDTSEHEATRNQFRVTGDEIVDRVVQEVGKRFEAQSRYAPPIRSRVWDVPHHWSRFFVGRDTLLARIHDQFAAKPYPVALVQAIQGLGGVGKTQVAVHYAYRYNSEYTGVWWLPAESAATLAARYAALADRLNLRVAEAADQQHRIEAVRSYLERTEETGERWLLIFDNAVPRSDSHRGVGSVNDYRPRRGNCDVLITSREKAWPLAEKHDVDVLTKDDAVRFLMERTGDYDEAAARQLAQELGYLPLALEQAGAYIDESLGQHSLASYLSLYRHRPLEHLAADRAKVGEYDDVVATTWFLSFDAVERQSPAAGELLRLCAYLASDRIPLGALIAHAEMLPTNVAATMRDLEAGPRAISLLLRYSLAEAAGSGLLNVHRLVQLVVREWLTDAERRSWSMAALAITDAAFPANVDDPQQWEICAQLVAHAHACVEHATSLVGESVEIGRLLTKAGMYLQQRALNEQAKADLERALNIVTVSLEFDISDLASALNNLASVLRSKSDLPEARSLLNLALVLLESVGEQDIPVMATTLNNLGNVMRAQGDLDEAQRLLTRSLAVHEQVFGANHPRVAAVLTNLANVLWYQRWFADARPLLERALQIDEIAYGPHHSEVATDLANLGSVLRAEGEITEARQMFERAIAIDKAVFKYDHPNVASRLAGLAMVAQAEDTGDSLDEAEFLLREALRINEAFYGATHSEVATNLNHLAGVLFAKGVLDEATTLLERVLEIAELTLETDHPALSLAYKNLAVVMAEQGNLPRANALFSQAAELRSHAAGQPNSHEMRFAKASTCRGPDRL